jgi:preprotein translocase subunit SecB
MNAQKTAAQSHAEFALQHLYVKDISFEAPKSPEVFSSKWEPETHVELATQSTRVSEKIYEVVLTITVTTKTQDSPAYIVEVEQAGIFMVNNFSAAQLEHFLAVYCPTMLFPYIREVVSGMIVKGGFAPLYLAPFNFEDLFRQRQNEAASKPQAQQHVHAPAPGV